MGLMMLAAGPGSELELRAEGPAAETVLDALERLVAEKFHEG
jgi:phosphocarrier protein